MKDLERMKEKIVKTALLNMFQNKGWMDITTIDKCLTVAEIVPEKEKYDMLNALHCIHWTAMDKETREWCVRTTAELFGEDPNDLSEIENMKVSFFKKILNKIIEVTPE